MSAGSVGREVEDECYPTAGDVVVETERGCFWTLRKERLGRWGTVVGFGERGGWTKGGYAQNHFFDVVVVLLGVVCLHLLAERCRFAC